MENIFATLDHLLKQNRKAVLARIIRQVGSAPRTIGTKCLILEDQSIIGTIGGGLLEHQVLQKAKEAMQQAHSLILRFQLKGEEVALSEMLCGGEADVLLEPIFPENAMAKKMFQRIAVMYREGRTGTLITLIAEGLDYRDETSRALLERGEEAIGPADSLIGSEQKKYHRIGKPLLFQKENSESLLFAEPIEPDCILYLFGAGHISTFVAPLAKMVGFRVVVIDDRQEFANRERFPAADEIMVCSFANVFHQLEIQATSYLAIVTRGHIHDREVLRSALKSKPAYIGMIGSKRKRELIYQSLLEEGVEPEQIERVHSPIGFAIGAETPEEIAVSIIAELIRERSLRQNLSNPDPDESKTS